MADATDATVVDAAPVSVAAAVADAGAAVERKPRVELPPGMSRNAFKRQMRDAKWDAGKDSRKCGGNKSTPGRALGRFVNRAPGAPP